MARWVSPEDRASAAVQSASQSASQSVPQSALDRQPPVWGVRVWGGLALGAIALALLPVLLPYLQDPEAYPLVNGGGLTQLQAFWQAALHPDLSQELLRVVGPATLTTLAYAVCGSSLSLLLGMVGGVLCSELWWESVFPGQRSAGFVWPLLRGLLVIPRGIHELLWGLILIHLWGTDPLTGIVAIALPFGAATAKIFSEILDDTPRVAWRSLLFAGASPLTALCYGILPQALLNLVSYGFYRFECSIRSAAVLGMIGVGGLGTEIQLSLQSLRYEQLWTFFYALVLLNSLVDWASARSRQQLGCTSRLAINAHAAGARRSWIRPNIRRAQPGPLFSNLLPFLFLGSLTLLCFAYLQPAWSDLASAQTLQRLQAFGQGIGSLDGSLLPQLPPLIGQTLAMSVLAIALASVGGTLLSFAAARRWPEPGQSWAYRLGTGIRLGLSRLILLFCRAIPAPVWALVLLYVLFPGILPGAIALALHNLGILGRLQAEVIENLNPAPLKSLQTQGIPPTLVFCYGILPLTLPSFLAYALYRWEVCLRETVIVGLVGAGGLGYLMMEQVSSFDNGGLVVTLGCFLGLTFAVDSLSSRMRRTLR